MKVYTDGSVLENEQAGAGFVIPDFKTEKSFYLGKGGAIFTAKLAALLTPLVNYLYTINI